MEAKALRHHLKVVDIYSNSWGPIDKICYNSIGPVTESALIDGVTLVCSIFVTYVSEHKKNNSHDVLLIDIKLTPIEKKKYVYKYRKTIPKSHQIVAIKEIMSKHLHDFII